MEDAALQRQAKFLGNSSVSTTLTFTDKAKVCELCATFRISGSAVFPVFSDYRWDRPKSQAQHDLHEEYQDVFPNFPNLKQRAKDGCSFCGFVRQSLQSEYRISEGWPAFSETPVRIVFTASVAEEVDNGSLRTILDKLKRRKRHTITIQVFGMTEGTNDLLLDFGITFQFSGEPTATNENPLSADNIKRITQWLQACDAGHSSCVAAKSAYTPTRLLSVKGGNLRIVVAEASSRYVALSYCWGTLTEKDKAFLTTKSNIKARLSGLKLQNLPRTLQDAVRTTQALGVDYIWIDSICIIQDDTDDWEREAITMGKVYKHACFTIAATNSSSSLDGFLHHRKPSAKASLPFFFSVVQDIFPGITDVEAERGNFHFRYPVETGIIDHLSECDWKKRGWTLQEEILSTRILSFTKDVIHFRCMRSEEVEASGYFGPLPLRFPALLADMEAMPFAKRLNGDSDYHYGWYEIIEDYSKRTLSYPGDKLAAVGGLAETFESLINDTYICGLWKSDLHRGLLWQSVSMSDIRGENGAPSWSWASRDGSITWDPSILHRDFMPVFPNGNIFDVRLVHKPDWTSLINEAGMLVSHEHSNCAIGAGKHLELVAPVASLQDIRLRYEHLRDALLKSGEELLTWLLPSNYEDPITLLSDGENQDLSLADTRVVLIAEKQKESIIHGILIQLVGDSGCFQRVGRFTHDPRHGLKSPKMTDFSSVRGVFRTERVILA